MNQGGFSFKGTRIAGLYSILIIVVYGIIWYIRHMFRK